MFYLKALVHICLLILLIHSFIACVQSDVPRPRGVSLSKASLYNPEKDFTCFDGSSTIPFSYVNDDYCDCFDGSDEPGTSACLNGIFYCTNAGYQPKKIPSTRVNDGICDCCDGTDEYSSNKECLNNCEELGREARDEAIRLMEIHKAGSEHRALLIQKGNQLRSEMAENLAQLEKDKMDAEKLKAEKEALKSEIEVKENEALKVYRDAADLEKMKQFEEEQNKNKKEAEETFVRFDTNQDGSLSIIELQVRNVCDKDKNGEVSDEEARYFLGEQDQVDLEEFISTSWPLLKPFIMMEKGMFRPEETQPESEPEDVEQEDFAAYDNEKAVEESEDNNDGDEQLPLDDEGDKTVVYDEETQKLIDAATDARGQFSDAERVVREIDSKIMAIKQNLEKDYGPQQEFASLDGECIEYEDKEYIYRLCLFQRAVQKPKNGGSEIGLGTWGEWAGEEGYKYKVMKYTNGVSCWNGPSRSTTVNIRCGLESKILSVSEPLRCEYKMELSTPAACDEININLNMAHDEL